MRFAREEVYIVAVTGNYGILSTSSVYINYYFQEQVFSESASLHNTDHILINIFREKPLKVVYMFM